MLNPAEVVAKVSHDIDEHIKRSRDYIAQNINIEISYQSESATLITITGNEKN